MGLVADLKNEPSHKIIEMGITVLKRLMHRGAVGSDPDTGDGAGILLALLLVRWWILPGLTAVGLLVGWKFTWSGPQWGNAALNEVWGTLENTVERWREKMKSDRPHG